MNVFIFSVETMNQVMNVRAHVYKPLLNGGSITVQLIWQQLPQATSYDIRIFTADSSMEMIAVCICVCICMCDCVCVCICMCDCVCACVCVCVLTCDIHYILYIGRMF